MNTRHLYTTQDGNVLVLEHIVAINNPYPSSTDLFFQVDMLGDVCYSYADVTFELCVHGVLRYDDTQEMDYYKTTERAELIKALAAI